MDARTESFFADTLDWMVTARQIKKPWPVEAAWTDLFALNQVVSFGEGKMPGRSKLAQRWGWSGTRASRLLRFFRASDDGLDFYRRKGEEWRLARADLFSLTGV